MAELNEGKIRKGGVNRKYQITKRPPAPPPMRRETTLCKKCAQYWPLALPNYSWEKGSKITIEHPDGVVEVFDPYIEAWHFESD